MNSNAIQGWFKKNNKSLLPAGALSAAFALWFGWYRGLSLAPKNPAEYLNAWLLETLGYWHVGFTERTGVYYSSGNGFMGINQTDLLSPLLGVDLHEFYVGTDQFFSLAVMAVTALFASALAIIRRDSKRLAALSVLLFVWLGLMLGAPTYWDFRYMLVFAYGMPVLLFLIFDKGRAA